MSEAKKLGDMIFLDWKSGRATIMSIREWRKQRTHELALGFVRDAIVEFVVWMLIAMVALVLISEL